MVDALNLIRLELDQRKLWRIAARHHLPADTDEGYVLHAGLCQLFAESDQKVRLPFRSFALDPTGARPGSVRLLAYSLLDEAALTGRMHEGHRDLLRNLASRPMPAISSGTKARFRLRACPVVRTRRPGPNDAEVTGRQKSREVDAWLAHRMRDWQPTPSRDESYPFERSAREWSEREQVYVGWLERQLAGAAEVQHASMTSFQRAKLYRRPHRAQRLVRPDVLLEGTLEVLDADAFRQCLRRGVGRHRAFGFGTLLLRGA